MEASSRPRRTVSVRFVLAFRYLVDDVDDAVAF
jgi:hypothetical protein